MEERLQVFADRINVALNSDDVLYGIYSALGDMKRNLSELHSIYYTGELFRFGEQDGKKCLEIISQRGDMFECWVHEDQKEYPGVTIGFKEFKYRMRNDGIEQRENTD